MYIPNVVMCREVWAHTFGSSAVSGHVGYYLYLDTANYEEVYVAC